MRLEAKNVSFRYTAKSPYVLQNLSFSLEEGERIGVVAPSGCGKTTFVKLLGGYEKPTRGKVLLDGSALPEKGFLPVQLIGQHPELLINPRWRMAKVLEEANQLNEEVMAELGIEKEWLRRYPRELSGGELQRFCIARALNPRTRFLIADEISTMLDVITQAQIWRYLLREVEQQGIGLIVVSHNPALVEQICRRAVDLRDINNC